jgi:hypothetical protein
MGLCIVHKLCRYDYPIPAKFATFAIHHLPDLASLHFGGICFFIYINACLPNYLLNPLGSSLVTLQLIASICLGIWIYHAWWVGRLVVVNTYQLSDQTNETADRWNFVVFESWVNLAETIICINQLTPTTTPWWWQYFCWNICRGSCSF